MGGEPLLWYWRFMNSQTKNDVVEIKPGQNWELYAQEIVKLDRAIERAQVNESLEAEAIANERAADFYSRWGRTKIAAVYLQDAYHCYSKLGDRAKTEELERRYPQLLKSIRPQIGDTNYFTDETIATFSHEFRTSLNGILGMSEALLEEVFGAMNEQQLNAVATIDRSGGYLLALINNMTDLSQLQVGKLELEIANVDVAELCRASCAFVKHHAIQKEIQLDTEIPADVGRISVDIQRMSQVLINLLDRAIESTPVGGKVTLVVTTDGDPWAEDTSTIQFAAIDTSKEIAANRANETNVVPIPNSNRRIGLGLMLVQPIVELHGGSLSFESAIGRGSCVKICLPRDCSPTDSTLNPLSSVEEDFAISSATKIDEISKPPLILIVEDNELNITTLASYLTAKKYRPIVAQDGAAAIELAQNYHPDIILMDIQMPGMDGLEAIARIREHAELSATPIIALTALALEGDREKCLAAGANEYLTKPVKLRQLNETIQQFLDSALDSGYAYSDFLI